MADWPLASSGNMELPAAISAPFIKSRLLISLIRSFRTLCGHKQIRLYGAYQLGRSHELESILVSDNRNTHILFGAPSEIRTPDRAIETHVLADEISSKTIRFEIIRDRNVHVRFSRKRTFKSPKIGGNQGPLSARSGRSQKVETPPKWTGFLFNNQVKADASLTSNGIDRISSSKRISAEILTR